MRVCTGRGSLGAWASKARIRRRSRWSAASCSRGAALRPQAVTRNPGARGARTKEADHGRDHEPCPAGFDALEVAEKLAPTWASRRDQIEAVSAPCREAMLRDLDPQPGETILELAAGN